MDVSSLIIVIAIVKQVCTCTINKLFYNILPTTYYLVR